MKYCKDPFETCGTIGPVEYLGHFANRSVINQGHNTDNSTLAGPKKKSLLESPNPVVTRRFEMEDPSLAPGQGASAEGAARQAKQEQLDRLKRTKMIQGQLGKYED